jgi:lysozyme
MTVMVDRSNNNGADNYAAAKRAGVTHAYFKASEGTGFTDSTYKTRKTEALAADLVVGAYHFAQHGTPLAEAEHFLSVIGTPAQGRMRPCLDLETGQTAAWAAAFVEHLHAKLGYWPVIYGNTSTIPALRAASVSVRACPWWRAEFGPNDGAHHALSGGAMGAAAHQYTSVAHFNGISGATDASVFLDEKAMLVPASKPAKPKVVGSEVSWVNKHAKRDSKHLRHVNPHTWMRLRHPRAWRRGRVIVTPIHKKP